MASKIMGQRPATPLPQAEGIAESADRAANLLLEILTLLHAGHDLQEGEQVLADCALLDSGTRFTFLMALARDKCEEAFRHADAIREEIRRG